MGDSIFRLPNGELEIFLDKPASTVQSIQIETSADLVTWTLRATFPAKGSPVGDREGKRNKAYYRFNPATYGLSAPYYMRFKNVTAGVAGTASAVRVILPPNIQHAGAVDVSGTAPNGATLASSTHLQVPGTLRFKITNNDTVDLKVAFSANGPENTLAADAVYEQEARIRDVYVRGDGATCAFTLQLVLAS